MALYHAKKQGRNRHFWFEPSMEHELRFRNQLETGIRRGINQSEFVPYYEQQIDIDSGELVGFEMLARWKSEQLGLVSPEIFIPIAEEMGLITQLSEQLMDRAFADARAVEAIIEVYPTLSPRLQNTAQKMLSEKPAWAAAMLQRMNAGTFSPGVLSSANVALIRGHADSRLSSLLTSYRQKHSDDPAQRAAQQQFETGRKSFNLTCAPCHQESGEGLAMLAPPLIGSRWLQQGDDALVRIVLHGKENP